MLDIETKRRIDEARDILVGKIPDPKGQVEQITIALIYKFMNDIDAESEELGGERIFFAGEFDKYRWANLVHSGLGGYEMLNLYAEALVRIPENPNIPPLFREIFNNVYLPYRDPETLRMFFNVIDDFTYDHSERLGDAFEHLLSVLGSQGDAGQFRTPRHIIDFMVKIIDPQKDERVMDPACGTAGFLVSSYKHIRDTSSDDRGRSTLTPDEHARLVTNLVGYDISPDMVRLSLVNMYLHGFPQPNIHEYDTLTSEERWDEYSNVILANPPFMSPKGGIRPHNRFSVQSGRSEVLFVDYIAEHLTPDGRAAVIVPEGIIFQSQNAHTQLRKMLVEEYLVAVVSLPQGVFNPYSGVKTSILVMDKSLARRTNQIAFFRVAHDGYDLGAQRRPVPENDLPTALDDINEYLRRVRAGETLDEFRPITGLIVDRKRIAEDDEYNLSVERYRESSLSLSDWPITALSDITTEIKPGFACGKGKVGTVGVPHIRPMNITAKGRLTWEGLKRINKEDYAGRKNYSLLPGDILFNNTNSKELVGKTCFIEERVEGGFSNHITRIRVAENRCDAEFLARVLHAAWQRGEFFERANRWVGQAGINTRSLSEFQIPLPPLGVQREIVEEIEGYQRVMDGARAVIENYRPHIAVDPEWPMVEIGEKDLFNVVNGGTPKTSVEDYWDGGIPWITLADLPPVNFVTEITSTERTISDEGLKRSSAKMIPANSVVVSSRATIGRIGINRIPISTNQGFKNIIIEDVTRAIPEYIAVALSRLVPEMEAQASGSTYKEIIKSRFVRLLIPLPPLNEQESIVAEIEAEQAIVDANRELVKRMEARIEATIGRVWETNPKA